MGKKIKKKLKSKRGTSAFIEISVLIIVCLMMFALLMSFLQMFSIDNRMRVMAQEISRYVEIKGQVNADTYAEFNRLKTVANFSEVRVEFSRSGRIQLEQEFVVTIYVKHAYGIGGIVVRHGEMKVSASGRSEVYWK